MVTITGLVARTYSGPFAPASKVTHAVWERGRTVCGQAALAVPLTWAGERVAPATVACISESVMRIRHAKIQPAANPHDRKREEDARLRVDLYERSEVHGIESEVL